MEKGVQWYLEKNTIWEVYSQTHHVKKKHHINYLHKLLA